MRKYKGFGIIEIIVAMAIMLILAVSGTTMITQTFSTNRLSEETTKAHLYAQEGIEAMKSIKKQNWNSLSVSGSACDSTKLGGAEIVIDLWQWTASSNIDGKYTRSIEIQNVCKDVNGEIVLLGGTVDPNMKRITSTVSWDFTSSRQNESKVITYLTNWNETLIAPQCDWSTISVVQTVDLTGSADVRDITFVDPFIYSANRSHYSNEFYSHDISDLQNIISSGINIGSNAYGLDTYGNRAYLATSSNTEIRTVDISDPYNPSLTGSSINLNRGENTLKILVDADNIYIARKRARNTGEFLIYDRQTLTLKDDYEVNNHVDNIFIDGQYAYLATSHNSFELIELDISDPYNISLVGTYNSQDGSNGRSVFFDGSYIYLSTSNNTGSHSGNADAEVYILQSNHTSPSPFTFINQYNVGDDVYDIKAYEDKIFLGTDLNAKEVLILDSSDINNLVELSFVDAQSRVYAIYTDIDNCRIYAGSRSNSQEISIIETGTGGNGGGGSTTEADVLSVNTSQLIVGGPGDRNLEDITIDNIDSVPITITHMRVTWINGKKKVKELKDIKVGKIEVFDKDTKSGELMDIDDIVIDPSTPLVITRIRFDGDLSGAIFDIEFHMSDLSILTISNLKPPDG